MRKEDLKTGMVVEIKDFEGTKLAMVCDTSRYGLCISGENAYFPISHLTDDLKHYDNLTNTYINRVYGLASTPKYASNISTVKRELLWERDHEPKVGDVYESMFGHLCVVTMVKDSNITKVYTDGSGGYENLEIFKRDYKFTGKNIGDKVDKLLKAI